MAVAAHKCEVVKKRTPPYTLLLLLGMGMMIPCYLFTAGNVLFSTWPLYNRNQPALWLLTVLCFAGLYLAMHCADRHEAFLAGHEKRILTAFAAFYFVVQLLMAQALRFTPITDAEQCYTAAQLLADTGTYGASERAWGYFTRYPFNLGIVYLLAGIFRFFGFFGWGDRFMQAVLVSSTLFTLGLLAGARVLRRIGGVKAQMRFLILTASCLPMLYCTTEIYTDSFSLAFPTMIIYCAMRIADARGRRDGRRYAQGSLILWTLLFALCGFAGSQIRFTSIIAAIACIIYLVLGEKPLRGAAACAALAVVMTAGGALVDAENAKHIDPAEMDRLSFSPLHHIAMGLPIHEDEGYGQYGYGGWYVFSSSFETQEERNAALLNEIIDRVYYLRYPNRLINMMSRKNLSTFGDGTFLLNEIIQADEPEPDNLVKQVIFYTGAGYPVYYHVCTAVFMAQMLFACAACVQVIRRRETRGAPVFIALVGAFILLCIWETRARYFFQFEMLLLCAAAMFVPKGIKKAEV